jgi:hypothetical protein
VPVCSLSSTHSRRKGRAPPQARRPRRRRRRRRRFAAEAAEAVEAAASSGAADAADAAENAAEAVAESVESAECLARGRLLCMSTAAGVGSGEGGALEGGAGGGGVGGGGVGGGGAGGGGVGGDTFVFEVRLVRSPPHADATGGAADAAGEGGEVSVLSPCRCNCVRAEGHGATAASFWAWAERLRNDVVRGTRKWRRLAAREAKPINGPS